MFRTILALVVTLGLSLAGPARADGPTEVANDIKEIVLAYHNYMDDHKGAAPAKQEDLSKAVSKRALGRLDDKSVVFIYGVTIKDMTAGTSNTILAYEKDAPEKGGLVGYGDGSVRKLTADEFKKATVAKAKK